jgi:hypothetical protein
MKSPVVAGWIERRVLVNYRVEPDALRGVLPEPFRPRLVRGQAIAGICLIRLRAVRPRGLPALVGIGSENAAHRVAVEWDGDDGVCQGVYVPRRDTSSGLNVLAGGRLFPGVQRRAQFDVREWDRGLSVAVRSRDGQTRIAVRGQVARALPPGSIFTSLWEASDFFQQGGLGYSPRGDLTGFEGMELRTEGWSVEPLEVDVVESSFFDDRARFPEGSIAFDCALLMRSTAHEWHARPALASRNTAPGLVPAF